MAGAGLSAGASEMKRSVTRDKLWRRVLILVFGVSILTLGGAMLSRLGPDTLSNILPYVPAQKEVVSHLRPAGNHLRQQPVLQSVTATTCDTTDLRDLQKKNPASIRVSKILKEMEHEFHSKGVKSNWGGIYMFPESVKAWASYFDMRARECSPIRTVCETGFATGHSAAVWLAYSDDIVVHSFDRGFVGAARTFIDKRFPGRLHTYQGSLNQVLCAPKFRDVKCDLIFLDVHEFMPKQLEIMAHFSHPHTLLLHDGGGPERDKARWDGFEATGLLNSDFDKVCGSSRSVAPLTHKDPKVTTYYCFAEIVPSSEAFNKTCLGS